MNPPNHEVTVLERYQVAPATPSPATVTEFSLPLTLFDIPWLYSNVSRLLFFESSLSKSQFLETLVPQLKDSLSITLKHFLGLAGKLRVPSSNTDWPEIRYTDGDSVSFVVAESGDADFHHLTGNHARNAGEFNGLVPPTPPLSPTEDSTVSSVLALQVTLFPNTGFCIGFTNLHVAGDASSIFNFMKTWAFISQQGENGEFILASESEPLPFYDRTVIKDPKGLGKTLWSQVRDIRIEDVFGHALLPGTSKVRATFVISRANIERLKKSVSSQRPGVAHLSSFTVVCAYVWTCIVKSRLGNGDQEFDEDKEMEQFGCAADCRSRLNPPIPANYFGNCLTFCLMTAKSWQLLGKEGFVFAAELIGQAIHQKFQGEDCVLRSAESWMSDFAKMNMERIVSVAGSPKFNYYELDFGQGKPAKFEFTSIDSTGAMALSRCRDSEGDMEISLSYPKPIMDAFAIIFAEGLKAL